MEQSGAEAVVAAIHDAALGRATWDEAVAALCSAVDAAGGLLARLPAPGAAAAPFGKAGGVPAGSAAQAGSAGALVLGAHRWSGPVDAVLAWLTDPWPDPLARHALAAAGGAQVLGAAIGTGSGRGAVLLTPHAGEGSGKGAEDCAALSARLGPMLPLLGRGLDVAARLSEEAAQADMFRLALGVLPMPILLIDADGRLRLANGAGDRLLRRGPALTLRDGRLATRRRRENAALQTAIARALAASRQRAADPPPTLTLRSREDHPVLSVLLVPVRSAVAEDAPGSLLIFASDLHTPPNFDLSLVMDQFALTPAESRVAAGVARGGDLRGISDDAGISIATARVHLKRVLAKVGAHSQAQLAGLLLRGLGVLDTGSLGWPRRVPRRAPKKGHGGN